MEEFEKLMIIMRRLKGIKKRKNEKKKRGSGD